MMQIMHWCKRIHCVYTIILYGSVIDLDEPHERDWMEGWTLRETLDEVNRIALFVSDPTRREFKNSVLTLVNFFWKNIEYFIYINVKS